MPQSTQPLFYALCVIKDFDMWAAILRGLGALGRSGGARAVGTTPKSPASIPKPAGTPITHTPTGPVYTGASKPPPGSTPFNVSRTVDYSKTATASPRNPTKIGFQPNIGEAPRKFDFSGSGGARTPVKPPPQKPTLQEQAKRLKDRQQQGSSTSEEMPYMSSLWGFHGGRGYAQGQQSLVWQSTTINNPYGRGPGGFRQAAEYSPMDYSPTLRETSGYVGGGSMDRGTSSQAMPTYSTTPAVNYPVPEETFETYTPYGH